MGSTGLCLKDLLKVAGYFILLVGGLIGLYFGITYLGYAMSWMDDIDDVTGCPNSMIRDYISDNITRSEWKCPEECSHKDYKSFYGKCFALGLVWVIILVPLIACGITSIGIFIAFLVSSIQRYYTYIPQPSGMV